MNENVLAAVIGLDEAEAFLVVVELYGAGSHCGILSLIRVRALEFGRATAWLELRFSMFGGSERAPGIQRGRNGLIVRPNVDHRHYRLRATFATPTESA